MKKYKKIISLLLIFVLAMTTFCFNLPAQAKKKNREKVSSVKFKNAKNKLTLKKGQTFKLKTTVKVNPNKKKFKKLKFTSSNKKVVTVNQKGALKAKKIGTAKITAVSRTNKKKKAVLKVTVTSGTYNDTPQTPTSSVTPAATSKPTASKTDRIITLAASEVLGSAGTNGTPDFKEDGSVTIKVTQDFGGGGIAFYMDSSHQKCDLSNYTKVIFRVTSDANAPACFNVYEGNSFWSDSNNVVTPLGYDSFTKGEKVFNFSLSAISRASGFGLKYNTYGKDPSEIPKEFTITIHSITLVRDLRSIDDATSNYSKLYELAENYGFKMGTVISDTTVNDDKYRNLMKYHFNSITAANEMKAYAMLDMDTSKETYKDEDSSMPALNFANADKIMDYAKGNNMRVRGHVLVWDAGMIDAFFRVGYDSSKDYATADVVRKRLKNYMTQVITHFEKKYPGIIYCWDVVNEAIGDSADDYASGDKRHVRTQRDGTENLFYKIMGDHYVEESFAYAHEIIEDLRRTNPSLDIKLYYNDYNTFFTDKRDAICELVKSINSYDANGKQLCDGVGMQSYIGGFGVQDGCMNDSHVTMVKNAIQKFASLGVDVQVTELAVRNYQNDEATLQKHAEFYKTLFRVYMDINSGVKKPLTAVCIWGIIDDPDMDKSDYSYAMNGTYCGLFDKYLGVKQSFVQIHNLMRDNVSS